MEGVEEQGKNCRRMATTLADDIPQFPERMVADNAPIKAIPALVKTIGHCTLVMAYWCCTRTSRVKCSIAKLMLQSKVSRILSPVGDRTCSPSSSSSIFPEDVAPAAFLFAASFFLACSKRPLCSAISRSVGSEGPDRLGCLSLIFFAIAIAVQSVCVALFETVRWNSGSGCPGKQIRKYQSRESSNSRAFPRNHARARKSGAVRIRTAIVAPPKLALQPKRTLTSLRFERFWGTQMKRGRDCRMRGPIQCARRASFYV